MSYAEETVAISQYPLSAALTCAKICTAFEEAWGVVWHGLINVSSTCRFLTILNIKETSQHLLQHSKLWLFWAGSAVMAWYSRQRRGRSRMWSNFVTSFANTFACFYKWTHITRSCYQVISNSSVLPSYLSSFDACSCFFCQIIWGNIWNWISLISCIPLESGTPTLQFPP